MAKDWDGLGGGWEKEEARDRKDQREAGEKLQ